MLSSRLRMCASRIAYGFSAVDFSLSRHDPGTAVFAVGDLYLVESLVDFVEVEFFPRLRKARNALRTPHRIDESMSLHWIEEVARAHNSMVPGLSDHAWHCCDPPDPFAGCPACPDPAGNPQTLRNAR